MADYDRLLPPLSTLVTFEAACRHGNFTRAAEELHVSQATVSRHIRDLETDLGVALFERQRHDVVTTPAGRELAASVRLSLGELASAADRLRRAANDQRSLTVLSSLSLASVVVAPALAELQRRHPDLRVRLLSGCDPIEETTDDFDVALQYWATDTEGFDIEFLTAEAVFPVCAPSFAATLGEPVTPEELPGLDLIDIEPVDPSTITWQAFLTRLGVEADEAGAPGPTFDSYQVCLDLAEQGRGVALGWERSVAPRLAAGRLVRLPGITVDDAGALHAFIPRHRARNPFVDEFLGQLRSAIADAAQPSTSRSAVS